jgi:glycosyltransferase involved in cell wall biosynthesis
MNNTTNSKSERNTMVSPEGLPLISIIMPVRNEGDFIGKAIRSLLENGYPVDKLEILIVDGESDDATITEIKSIMADFNQISLHNNPARIVPIALNIGLEVASGEIIFRLDGHAEFLPGYLERAVRFLQGNPEYGCVGAPILTIGTSDTGKAIQCAMSSSFGVGNSRARTADFEGEVDSVAFGGYQRFVFDRIGIFDEELVRNQDDEFNHRMWNNNIPIYMFREYGSQYYSRSTFRSLCRQYFQYGFWKIRVMQKWGKVFTLRSVIPLIFILGLLGSLLIGLLWYWAFPCLYLGVYLTFLLVGTLREKRDCGCRLKVFWAYLVLHFAYGAGEIVGISKYILKLRISEQTRLSR